MNLISREELKKKLDRGDDFKLVMVLGDFHFRAMHILGSLNISTPEQVVGVLHPDDEIVVYCSNTACPASQLAYRQLEAGGYKKISRYAEGLAGWQEASYSLEGDWVK